MNRSSRQGVDYGPSSFGVSCTGLGVDMDIIVLLTKDKFSKQMRVAYSLVEIQSYDGGTDDLDKELTSGTGVKGTCENWAGAARKSPWVGFK